jgi:hypothetical protein
MDLGSVLFPVPWCLVRVRVMRALQREAFAYAPDPSPYI